MNTKRDGFTIVELMAAVMISSILAVTVGAMLYCAYTNWNKNSKAIELQRDLALAMDMIARVARPASGADITASGPSLTVISGLTAKSFYLSGNSLYYDPDINMPNNEIVLIDNKVVSLSFSKDLEYDPPHCVHIVDMALQDGSMNTAVDTLIAYRNN